MPSVCEGLDASCRGVANGFEKMDTMLLLPYLHTRDILKSVDDEDEDMGANALVMIL